VSIPPEPVVLLPARCERPALAALRASLLHAMGGDRLAIDCRHLTHIDAAGLQLLCAATRTAAQRSIPVAWTSPPPVLITAATTLGLIFDLGLTDGLEA
jgi:anti-anti-sigma regulatory factor